MFMLGSMLLACAFAQDAAPAKAVDAALLDGLIQKTNDLRAFVAVYRVHVPEQTGDLSIRITFRAPDEMKCELPGHAFMCAREGSLDVQTPSSDGKSMVASVPFDEQIQGRWTRFTDVLHAEFSEATDDWTATMSSGALIDMRITPDGEGAKENFQFQVDYVCFRTAVLGWLEMFKRWTGTQTEDEEHIVFRTSRGSEVSLSKRTGFIDSIRKQKKEGVSTIELETLDLDPKLDAHSFDVPEPPAGATDASAQFSASLQLAATLALRRELFAWASRHVSDKKIEWNAEARAHFRRALAALHADGIALEMEPWISETKKWIESTGAWLHERYAGLSKTDDAARGELEAKAQEARDKLAGRLERASTGRVSNLNIDATVVPDPTLRSSLLELERAAVETTFEHSLQSPLLESFDAQVERAKKQ
jgi:hypothetical protein